MFRHVHQAINPVLQRAHRRLTVFQNHQSQASPVSVSTRDTLPTRAHQQTLQERLTRKGAYQEGSLHCTRDGIRCPCTELDAFPPDEADNEGYTSRYLSHQRISASFPCPTHIKEVGGNVPE